MLLVYLSRRLCIVGESGIFVDDADFFGKLRNGNFRNVRGLSDVRSDC